MENLEQELPEAPQGPSAPPTLRAHVVQMLSARHSVGQVQAR